MSVSKVKIIISRFNENLNWLQESPFNEFQYIVYNKGDNDNFNKTNVVSIVNLPNVGKCDHTYLYHIVNNFDNLDDILVFLPGSLYSSSEKKSRALDILERIKRNNYNSAVFIGDFCSGLLKQFGNFTMDSYSTSSPENYNKNMETATHLANIRPFWKWYLVNFGRIHVNYYTYKGIFSVDKRDILQHPRYRFEKLMNQVAVHSNPEVGHYIERTWGAIFYPMTHTRILINNIPSFRLRRVGRYNALRKRGWGYIRYRLNKFRK